MAGWLEIAEGHRPARRSHQRRHRPARRPLGPGRARDRIVHRINRSVDASPSRRWQPGAAMEVTGTSLLALGTELLARAGVEAPEDDARALVALFERRAAREPL